MNRLRQRITLLFLMNIYFIYKVIAAFLEGNEFEIILWTIVLIIYSISLTALYLILRRQRAKQVNRLKNGKNT